ncbi:aa3-type cytochrome oxidase subunit IV [Rhabdothermincola sediminis]|uniref:aa3-type cytochrome oxidase subunit IV n=1 Tax=Rhabdothermincola sediminis TaxID=2751370 RepID=UPI001AA095BF|nr:cytochrome c oxidase subunit 4 [Rhabdothermincola sediminis]
MSGGQEEFPVPAIEDEGGTHVATGISAVEPPRGLPTESKVFLAIGGFYLLIAVIYAATAYEWAGVALLGLASVFAFIVAGYLAWRVRDVQPEAEATEYPDLAGPPVHEGLYLPHSSVWPLGAGAGAALMLAGIPFGWFVWVPGVAVLGLSLVGAARQSRDRA